MAKTTDLLSSCCVNLILPDACIHLSTWLLLHLKTCLYNYRNPGAVVCTTNTESSTTFFIRIWPDMIPPWASQHWQCPASKESNHCSSSGEARHSDSVMILQSSEQYLPPLPPKPPESLDLLVLYPQAASPRAIKNPRASYLPVPWMPWLLDFPVLFLTI